jgi:hypothetical protein
VWALNSFTFALRLGQQKIEIASSPIGLVSPPRATNKNLHAQGGVSTVHVIHPVRGDSQTDRRALDELDFQPIQLASVDKEPTFYHFTLPQSEARELLWLLAREGITGAKCFPGYDGVVTAIREMEFYPQPRL